MLTKFLQKILLRLIHFFPADRKERLIVKLVQQHGQTLPPDEALRFLFRLDAATYSLEGPLAVAYGDGVHPKHRHTGYHDFFTERIKPGERVLDIGCGTGEVAADLAKAGAFVDGVDLDPENVAKANKRHAHHNLHFWVGDATQMAVEDAYDTVLLSNVLEHLNDRAQFLKKIMAASRAKRIFIRVPLFERDWRVPLKKELNVEWRLDLDHKTEYLLSDFEKEITEAGLSIKHIEVHWGEIWSELAPVGQGK